MVHRGLEILLPGDSLAAERVRRFNSIDKDAWERELNAVSNTTASLAHNDIHRSEVSDVEQNSGRECVVIQSIQPAQSTCSTATQQTPLLEYETVPDSSENDLVQFNIDSSDSIGCLGQSSDQTLPPSTSDQRDAAEARTNAGAATKCSQRELVCGLQALFGPSYWYSQHMVELVATDPAECAPANRLREQRRLCQEVQIYAVFAATSRAVNMKCLVNSPAMLLQAAQQEVLRLSCSVENRAQLDCEQGLSNPSRVDTLSTQANHHARSMSVPGVHVSGASASISMPDIEPDHDYGRIFGQTAVKSAYSVMLKDQCWCAVRILLSVHGIGMRKAALIYNRHQCRSSTPDSKGSVHGATSAAALPDVSTILLKEHLNLTPCQQLALDVRGHEMAPRLCPQSVVTEVFDRLVAQCQANVVDGVAFRCRARRIASDSIGSIRCRYALEVVLSYSMVAECGLHARSVQRAQTDHSSVFTGVEVSTLKSKIRRHVETLLNCLEGKAHECAQGVAVLASEKVLSIPVSSAAADALDQAQFAVHGFAWDVGDSEANDCMEIKRQRSCRQNDEPSESERLCAHVTLGKWNPLLLDLRIVPSNWCRLGRAWYSMGPEHLSRQILASHGTEAVQHLARFCDG